MALRQSSKLIAMTVPRDPAIDIAVLYERVEHIIRQIDQLSRAVEQNNKHRDAQLVEIEERVEHVERTIDRARWFLFGLAAAGGAIGGTVASVISQALGG